MNLVTNQKNNKFIKITAMVVVSIGIIAVTLFYLSNKSFLNNKTSNLPSGSTTPQISNVEAKKVDAIISEAIKAQLDRKSTPKEEVYIQASLGLGASENHWKNLGIEIANISSTEEKNLYLMTIESIKAQLEYYTTSKEESLEKVKDLYLPEAFEQYKKDVKNEVGRFGFNFYNKIEKVSFSKPRAYKDLPGRVGIITYVSFTTNDTNNLVPLFVFKNVNGEWKIEKQGEIIVRLDADEDSLIQEIKK